MNQWLEEHLAAEQIVIDTLITDTKTYEFRDMTIDRRALEFIQAIPDLIFVDFWNCELPGDELFSILKDKNVRHSRFCWIQFREQDLQLFKQLKYITSLQLSDAKLDDRLLASFPDLPLLDDLSLNWNEITGTALSKMPQFLNLTQLHLADNQLKSLEFISNLTKLEYLDIDNNKLTNYHLGALENLASLKTLVLVHNEQIDDGAVEAISKCAALQDLYLSFPIAIPNIERLLATTKLHKLFLYDLYDGRQVYSSAYREQLMQFQAERAPDLYFEFETELE